jgi:hypothetical protein
MKKPRASPWLKKQHLPLADQGLAWLPPSLVMLLIAAVVDRVKGREQVSAGKPVVKEKSVPSATSERKPVRVL